MTENNTLITIAYGDGVGSEIMEANLMVMREAGAELTIETIEIGERIYNMGAISGILPSAWEVLKRSKILLKAPTIIPEYPVLPLETPYREVNDAIREYFGLSAEHRIISDMATASINENFAMFEQMHEAMPELAGKNKASPIPMLQAAILMLEYIGQNQVAGRIKKAIEKSDIKKQNTKEIAEQILNNLWSA